MPAGSLVATNNAPPTVMGVTLGIGYGGDGRSHAKMRLDLFLPPLETFVGIRGMERDIALSNHGNTWLAVSGCRMISRKDRPTAIRSTPAKPVRELRFPEPRAGARAGVP